ALYTPPGETKPRRTPAPVGIPPRVKGFLFARPHQAVLEDPGILTGNDKPLPIPRIHGASQRSAGRAPDGKHAKAGISAFAAAVDQRRKTRQAEPAEPAKRDQPAKNRWDGRGSSRGDHGCGAWGRGSAAAPNDERTDLKAWRKSVTSRKT